MKKIKKNYFKYVFSMFSIVSIFLFSGNTLSKESLLSEELKPQSEILKNISALSDEQLYALAKKINEDGLPGESDYAQILLTEAIRKNPTNVNALLEAARVTELQSILPLAKIQKQFGFVYQAFLIDPNNPKVRYKFADLLLELDQKELFQKIYSQTLQEFPDHLETNIEKISIYAKTDPKMAIELSKDTLKNGGDIADFLPDFLVALQKSDRIENFSKNLLFYAEEYPNRWLWYHLGLQYMKEHNYNKAETAFKKSVLLGNNIVGQLQLGILRYRNTNKIPEAISNLQAVIKLLKDNPFISTHLIYFAHVQLTCALMLSKNSQATMQELRFVSKYSYQNRSYFTDLINEFLKNGHDDMLEEPMKIAIENDPLFADPYNVLANIFKKQKKEKLAYDLYKKFLVLNSQKK